MREHSRITKLAFFGTEKGALQGAQQRGVAQLGRALGWGPSRRRFKFCLPDYWSTYAHVERQGRVNRMKDDTEPEYDPMADPPKLYSLSEWVEVMCAELRRYERKWTDKNEYHKGKHTWSEWVNGFIRYMSW